MNAFFALFLHLDKVLGEVITQYGPWVYGILFAVIFAETGLVVTPFLPGDSLLFAAGSFAAAGSLNIYVLLLLLWLAAVLGDNVNYWIGKKVGKRVMERGRFIGIPVKREYLDRTRAFFERYGTRTIIYARFAPIVRTFAPFVAGLGAMKYRTFLSYDLLGGAIWVSVFTLGGYFFGSLPIVKNNFTLAIMAIIIISLIPAVVHAIRARKP